MTENDEEEKLSKYSAQRRMQKNKMERQVRQSQMWLKRFRILTRFVMIILLFASEIFNTSFN